MNPTMRKNAFLASARSISGVLMVPRLRLPVSLVMLSLCIAFASVPRDRAGIESGRQRDQRRVEVEGQVGVGPRGPAIVRRAAGGQGGAADGERIERVGGLADAGRGELADGPLPRVVMQGGAELQAGYQADQVHPQPQFGDVLRPVVVGRDY